MKKHLIFWGGWDGHQPKQCADLLAPLFAARGHDVVVRDTLAALDDADEVKSYDLITPIWTMGTIGKEQSQNLVGAVRAGTGLAGFHGGAGDSFRGNIDYQWMVGGQFLSHPDNIKDYTVHIVDRTDPIVAGIDDFAYRSEQYYMMVDPMNHVLATTTFDSTSAPWVNGTVMPTIWRKHHGAGRVFYSALGHQAHEFEVPQMREIFLRGSLWAAR
jgi:type 1 glutamine amidotransferase